MLLTASTVNARDMNKAKISSVDLNKSEKINVYGKSQNIKYRKKSKRADCSPLKGQKPFK